MRVHIVDDEVLASPSPRNLRLYLRTHGWQRQGSGSTTPDIWTFPSNVGAYEVIAPSSREARDYAARVSELLRTLSIAEDRSQLDILRDVVTLAFDVQYVRTIHASPVGTAPLAVAASAFDAAHAMLAAAAASLDEPRLVLPSRRSTRTAEFMKKVLAGPTSEGSYVISIWVPVPPRLTQEEDSVLFDSAGEPYERAATRRLHAALTALEAAARDVMDGEVGLDAFTERQDVGLSANLCEAVAALGSDGETPVQIRFAWALDRPQPEATSDIYFDSEALTVIQEAARELRALAPEEEARIHGNVVRLHREGQTGGGEVTIAGVVVGDPSEKLRRVYVSLSEAEYEEAISAHQSFSEVEIIGSMVQRGTRTHLTAAGTFRVQPTSR